MGHHHEDESRCMVCGQPMGESEARRLLKKEFGDGEKLIKDMLIKPVKMRMLQEMMGLEDDQMARLHDILTSAKKQMIQLEMQKKLTKIDLINLLIRKDLDIGQVDQKIREKANLKAEMRITWVRAIHEMRGELTEEQRENLEWMMMSFWMEDSDMYEMEEEEEEDEEEQEEEEDEGQGISE